MPTLTRELQVYPSAPRLTEYFGAGSSGGNVLVPARTLRRSRLRGRFELSAGELRFTYDYDSLPDGEHRLVNELYISKNRYDVNSGDNRVVQEDWGVTFEVREVNSSSITLRCTQSGGQQLGELVIDLFFIDSAREEASLPRLDGDTDIDSYQPRTIIFRDTVSEITLDWKDIYGELSPGDYLLSLRVTDAYDPADTHPVMSKFESRQSYTIPFAVS